MKYKLENTEVTIKNGQSRETGNTGHTRGGKSKQKQTQYAIDTKLFLSSSAKQL